MRKQILFFLTVLCIASAMAQDDKQTFTRKILMEQFTTANCGYCPAGIDRIATAISGTSNVIWIKHHSGYGEDALTCDVAREMMAFYNASTFAPALMVDRTLFDHSKPGPVTSVGNVSEIRSILSEAKNVETYCKVYPVEVSFDPSSRRVRCTVSGRFGAEVYGDSTRLTVFVVEDSIFMQQHDYYNGVSSNAYAVDYWHSSTVRDAVTGIWGDTLEVDAANDHSFSHTFDYVLPEDFVYKNCKLVAFVYNYDPDDVNNCAVLNAAESKYLDQNLGVGTIAEGCQMRLYPNPAMDMVVVEMNDGQEVAKDGRVTLYDMAGRELMSVPTNGSAYCRLDLGSLPQGVYLVRVQTSEGVASRQLVRQ